MPYIRKLPNDNSFYWFARSWYLTFCRFTQDTGSGMTLYVILIYAINFQVSIDGGGQTQYQFDGVCDPTASSCAFVYNFTAYNTQSLQPGDHTLDLKLLNATGINANQNLTLFQFQYAVVNETDAFPTQAISLTSTPSTVAARTSTTSTAAPYTSTTSTATPPSPAPSTAQ
jgi:hypothetical protein